LHYLSTHWVLVIGMIFLILSFVLVPQVTGERGGVRFWIPLLGLVGILEVVTAAYLRRQKVLSALDSHGDAQTEETGSERNPPPA
jgi:hypothetical protein